MVVTLLSFIIFISCFIVLGAVYMMLISFNIVKKKKLEKVVRLVAVYSLFVTLIYIFQHIFM